jgi:hypothetical protein
MTLHCIAGAMQIEAAMTGVKSRTIPPLRVSEQLRADAEAVRYLRLMTVIRLP